MALILCPECNAQVSHQAEHCPHCGFPIRKYCAGELRPTPAATPQAPEPTVPRNVSPEPPANVSAPEPSRTKGHETLKIILMFLVVAAIVAYFALPYFINN